MNSLGGSPATLLLHVGYGRSAYVADIIGVVSVQRINDSAALAKDEGRTADQQFYDAVLEILLDWYSHDQDDMTVPI